MHKKFNEFEILIRIINLVPVSLPVAVSIIVVVIGPSPSSSVLAVSLSA